MVSKDQERYNEAIKKIWALSENQSVLAEIVEAIDYYVFSINKEKEDAVERCIDTLMGRCVSPDYHGNMTFYEFIDAGGNRCPICVKEELEKRGPVLNGR